MYKLILASASPRRRELLSHLDINYEIVSADIAEITTCQLHHEMAMDIAKQKAHAVKAKFSVPDLDKLVFLAADTMVCLGSKVLGKPEIEIEAMEMLMQLSGKTHEVITGVHLLSPFKEQSFFVKTEVTFFPLEKREVQLYLNKKTYSDKAGAYGAQDMAQLFIREIKGSYANVVGLPIAELRIAFQDFFDGDENWRAQIES
jgi:septum formation protein